MKRIRKLTTAFLVIALLVTSLVSVPALAEEDGKVHRIAGASRYLTAVEVSKKAYKEAETVIIAAGANLNFPDALAASALAGKEEAPILLAEQDGFRAGTLEEIARLGAKKAIVLGGEKALGKEVVDALEDAGLKVTRIAGENRYETAALIAAEVLGTGKEVFLVNGDEPWDALAIGPVAARDGIPVLLTKAGALRAETKAFLVDKGIKTVTILGGDKAVSPAVRAEIPASVSSVKRVHGLNREATAIEIAERFFDAPEAVIIASRDKFADALVGGYFGGLLDAPIMLVYEKKIRENVEEYLWDNQQVGDIYILGGEAVIGKAVVEEIEEIGVVKSVEAIAGQKIKSTSTLDLDASLKFLLNGKKELTIAEFETLYAGLDYTVSYEYNTATPKAAGTHKYAVKAVKGVVTIPAGGVKAGDFKDYDVLAPGVPVEVTKWGLETKADYMALGDGPVKVVVFEAIDIFGKKVENPASLTFKSLESSKPAVLKIEIEDGEATATPQTLGTATLTAEFVGLAGKYRQVITVKPEREVTKLGNKKVVTWTEYAPADEGGWKGILEWLDQYGEEADAPLDDDDSDDFKVTIKKGSARVEYDVPRTTEGTYTVSVANKAGTKSYGSFVYQTIDLKDIVERDPRATYALTIFDPDETGKTELEYFFFDNVADSLDLAIEVRIKGVLLKAADAATVLGDYGYADGEFFAESSNPWLASVEYDGTHDPLLVKVTKKIDETDKPLFAPSGTVGVSLKYVYESYKPTFVSKDIKVVNTTPQVNSLVKLVAKLPVVGAGTVASPYKIKYEGLLYSADLDDERYPGGFALEYVKSVAYNGETDVVTVTVIGAFGGKSFTFPGVYLGLTES